MTQPRNESDKVRTVQWQRHNFSKSTNNWELGSSRHCWLHHWRNCFMQWRADCWVVDQKKFVLTKFIPLVHISLFLCSTQPVNYKFILKYFTDNLNYHKCCSSLGYSQAMALSHGVYHRCQKDQCIYTKMESRCSINTARVIFQDLQSQNRTIWKNCSERDGLIPQVGTPSNYPWLVFFSRQLSFKYAYFNEMCLVRTPSLWSAVLRSTTYVENWIKQPNPQCYFHNQFTFP